MPQLIKTSLIGLFGLALLTTSNSTAFAASGSAKPNPTNVQTSYQCAQQSISIKQGSKSININNGSACATTTSSTNQTCSSNFISIRQANQSVNIGGNGACVAAVNPSTLPSQPKTQTTPTVKPTGQVLGATPTPTPAAPSQLPSTGPGSAVAVSLGGIVFTLMLKRHLIFS